MTPPTLSPEEEAQNERALSRVGSVLLEKWHVDAVLGVGGMAAVYSATHHNGRRVAIKILHGELAHVVEARERFMEEAYAANRVQHPGTVPVLDDGVTADGCAFLVMELLEGETLEARMQRAGRALSGIEVLALMDALLDVLAAAHAKDMVHRDVKPENVFLTTDGHVKLLDFGIARMRETRRTLRTQTGATMGTPAFMSPEQARGRWDELDARSDLWSVGATMFVLLSGSLVHDAETLNEQLLAAMTKAAPPIQSVAQLVPDAVAHIVDRALALHADDRFESALAMQAAVREVHAQLTDSAAAEGRISSPPVAGGPIEPFYVPGVERHSTYRPVTATERPPGFKPPPWPLLAAVGAFVVGGLLFSVYLASSEPERIGSPVVAEQPAAAEPLEFSPPKEAPESEPLPSSERPAPSPPPPESEPLPSSERPAPSPPASAVRTERTERPTAKSAVSVKTSEQPTRADLRGSSPEPTSPVPEGSSDPDPLSRRR